MCQSTKSRKPARQLGTEEPFEIEEAGAKVERCSQRRIETNLRIWKLHRSLIFFSFKGAKIWCCDLMSRGILSSRWQIVGGKSSQVPQLTWSSQEGRGTWLVFFMLFSDEWDLKSKPTKLCWAKFFKCSDWLLPMGVFPRLKQTQYWEQWKPIPALGNVYSRATCSNHPHLFCQSLTP